MGEAHEWLFEPSFNRAVKGFASDDRITSDAGLILLREVDHRLGLTEWLAAGWRGRTGFAEALVAIDLFGGFLEARCAPPPCRWRLRKAPASRRRPRPEMVCSEDFTHPTKLRSAR